MINNNENEVENKKINRKDMTQIELGLDMDTNDYAKYKMCLSIMMVICIKQHLRNIWSSNDEKVKQHWGWVKKKRCV